MRRVVFGFVFVVFLASTTSIVSADVRTDQRVRFQLGGAIGKLVNMFGGKGAREGVTSIVAVKGNRKATMSDSTGQIIDLVRREDLRPRHQEEDLQGDDVRRSCAPKWKRRSARPSRARARWSAQ